MIPKEANYIRISDFNYTLPDECIARYPLTDRNGSKLLVFEGGNIQSSMFNLLPELLPSNSLLVFNNTRVIQARLHFRKTSGATIELFCLSPVQPSEYTTMFDSYGPVEWECLIGNAKRWKTGVLELNVPVPAGNFTLQARRISETEGKSIVQLMWDARELTFGQVLEYAGKIPVPPYLKRESEAIDRHRYQTVYSLRPGSVAAPTAGLHFSETELQKLDEKKIDRAYLALHVGAGTFQPVKTETIAGHTMHTEVFSADRELITTLAGYEGAIIPVGTTSLRALESLYHLGCSLQIFEKGGMPHLTQWQAYSSPHRSRSEAMYQLLRYLDHCEKDELTASTAIMIMPGYKFRMTDALITNFHQPGSTLLLLVSALIGESWKDVYTFALANNYRFLSYGDSSLLWPVKP